MVRLNRPRFGKLHIEQVHQTRVAAPMAPADESPEALNDRGRPSAVGDHKRK
jgi:hypothetical protein